MKRHSVWTKTGEKEVVPGYRPSSESSFPTESDDHVDYARLVAAEQRALQNQCSGNVHRLLAAVAAHWKPHQLDSAPAVMESERDSDIFENFLSLAARVRAGEADAIAEADNLDWRVFDLIEDSLISQELRSLASAEAPLTLGSLLHTHDGALTTCKPCIFFHRAKCFRGVKCSFCHYNHMNASGAIKGSKRLRPSKRTRELIKQINQASLPESDQNANPNQHESVSTGQPY